MPNKRQLCDIRQSFIQTHYTRSDSERPNSVQIIFGAQRNGRWLTTIRTACIAVVLAAASGSLINKMENEIEDEMSYRFGLNMFVQLSSRPLSAQSLKLTFNGNEMRINIRFRTTTHAPSFEIRPNFNIRVSRAPFVLFTNWSCESTGRQHAISFWLYVRSMRVTTSHRHSESAFAPRFRIV